MKFELMLDKAFQIICNWREGLFKFCTIFSCTFFADAEIMVDVVINSEVNVSFTAQ